MRKLRDKAEEKL